MPIRPERRHLYPPEWPQIRLRIQARARNCCEFCGVRNHAFGGRLKDGTFLPAHALKENMLRLVWPLPGTYAVCGDGKRCVVLRIIRIVCTTAHLDHDETNCSDENLRFLCQRCHLLHDAVIHAQHAYETRRAGKAMDMFEVRK